MRDKLSHYCFDRYPLEKTVYQRISYIAYMVLQYVWPQLKVFGNYEILFFASFTFEITFLLYRGSLTNIFELLSIFLKLIMIIYTGLYMRCSKPSRMGNPIDITHSGFKCLIFNDQLVVSFENLFLFHQIKNLTLFNELNFLRNICLNFNPPIIN